MSIKGAVFVISQLSMLLFPGICLFPAIPITVHKKRPSHFRLLRQPPFLVIGEELFGRIVLFMFAVQPSLERFQIFFGCKTRLVGSILMTAGI